MCGSYLGCPEGYFMHVKAKSASGRQPVCSFRLARTNSERFQAEPDLSQFLCSGSAYEGVTANDEVSSSVPITQPLCELVAPSRELMSLGPARITLREQSVRLSGDVREKD